ncbi:hypothetical protein [Halobacillus karajensis]|uniref:hypothetical protein n=1 Tax=Halobacillus karajensis TaxID=195088 RepID=UPI00045C799D|nr:hypothetical protein [Halobacillus karajensis]CDQ21746.1 hypothetical protein BN982_04155 [Halobacillus karajensis]
MSEYKIAQILKHALQYYVERPDASEKDIEEEKKVLNSVTEEVNDMKEKYGIE